MWQGYAVIAMICFAIMQLFFAYLSRRGMPPPAILLFIFAFGALYYLLHVSVHRTPLTMTPALIGTLALAAGLSYIGNFCAVRALSLAPNPGYSVAIVGLNAALVTLAAVVAFGAPLTWVKGLGVMLCGLGVALLVI